jgi:hypothetical protein
MKSIKEIKEEISAHHGFIGCVASNVIEDFLKALIENSALHHSDFTTNESEARIKALLTTKDEQLQKAIKSLNYYGNPKFDRVCFLDHSTCEEHYGADARNTVAQIKGKLDYE